METINGKSFEGIVQSVYIKTEIGVFRPQYFDKETGQRLIINRNGLVKVDRTPDAIVLLKSGRKQVWVGGTETAKLNQEEKDQLFEIIDNLFNKDSSIENWLDGPFLEVILTKIDGSKYSYSGWSNVINDHKFSQLLRKYSGLKYLEALDGDTEEACPTPFLPPEENEIINNYVVIDKNIKSGVL